MTGIGPSSEIGSRRISCILSFRQPLDQSPLDRQQGEGDRVQVHPRAWATACQAGRSMPITEPSPPTWICPADQNQD